MSTIKNTRYTAQKSQPTHSPKRKNNGNTLCIQTPLQRVDHRILSIPGIKCIEMALRRHMWLRFDGVRPVFKKKGNSIYVMCVLLSRLAGCWNNLPGRRIDPTIPYGPALLSIYKVLRSFCCLGLDGFLPIEKKKIFLIYWRSARYFRGWFAQLAAETS